MCPPENGTTAEGNTSTASSTETPSTVATVPSFHKKMGFTDTIFSGTWYIAEGWEYYKGNKVQLKNEILSGLTVAIAQVPESVAFR
jgi:MFS superfamily sulfate permease-like transporter